TNNELINVPQHIQKQQQYEQKKKNRGNRKLQRYRRKLRKYGMHPDDIISLVDPQTDIDSQENSNILNQTVISKQCLVSSGQQRKNMKIKKNLKRLTHINEINSFKTIQTLKTIWIIEHNLIDYTDISDQTFFHILSTACDANTDKHKCLLNEKQKQIQLVRHYATLIDRLSYAKLQVLQWNYYHHIGTTQHIGTRRISKQLAEKNSICYKYGKPKTLIDQRLKKSQEELQQAQHAVQYFEEIILCNAAPHMDCHSKIQSLSSILQKFVHQMQENIRDAYEYKRRKLRIWQATEKQTMLDEQVALSEKRRSSKQVPPASVLLDYMIHHIDIMLSKPKDTIEQNALTNVSHDQLEKINQLKHDIIQFEMQSAVINAIEARRLHMIKRAKYLLQHKLIASATRIWRVTTKHIMKNEQIAILEQRLISKQPLPASTLFDHTINRIETSLTQLDNVMVQDDKSIIFPSSQFDTMNQSKHNIINQSIITAREMAENSAQIILDETQKLLSFKHDDQHSHEVHMTVVNAIEDRRFHMMQCGNHMIKEKLAIYLRQN
ncbi:unnamed protein product, partial [Adineta steineri]